MNDMWPRDFLTFALDGDEWPPSCPSLFTLKKEPRQPMNTRLGGPQNCCGRFSKQKISMPLLGFKIRTVQPAA